MTLEEGEEPLRPFPFADAKGNYVAAVSERGRLLLFAIEEMRQLARGRGVIVMGLEQGERLAAVAVSNQKELTIRGIGRGGRERTVTLKGEKLIHHAGHRARMGRVLPDKLKPAALEVTPPKPAES
jgi:topoisomerase-4 subunit A